MTDYLQHKNDFNHPEIASAVDQLSFWSSRFGALLFDNMELRRDINFLDVGCGTGFPLFELAQAHGSSCQATGLDNWTEALDRARQKLKTYGLGNVTLVEADAAQMPLADGQYDLVVSALGVNNFSDPWAVLAECFRVAKPGARLALTTNIEGHMREFYDVYRETLLELDKSHHLGRLRANEMHRGTKESICGLLEQSGFTVVKTVESSFQMRYLDAGAFFNHFLTKIGFLDGWRDVVEPDEEREVFAALENKLNALAERQGGLRMTVPMLYVEGRKPEASVSSTA